VRPGVRPAVGDLAPSKAPDGPAESQPTQVSDAGAQVSTGTWLRPRPDQTNRAIEAGLRQSSRHDNLVGLLRLRGAAPPLVPLVREPTAKDSASSSSCEALTPTAAEPLPGRRGARRGEGDRLARCADAESEPFTVTYEGRIALHDDASLDR